VAANYVDGRLTLTVAAAAQPEARTIEISTNAPEAIEASTEAPEDQPENGTSESA
jgi:hypothetical protein